MVVKVAEGDVFTTKEEIAQSVKDELTKSMEAFGYQIIQTLVTDIAPDIRVKNSMNEINAAQRMRIAAKYFASASPSATFTTIIFSASALSLAAILIL